MAHCLALIAENDRRYEERFRSTQKELDMAVANRTTTVNAAFHEVDLRYGQRFDAADRAVMKAELATEKRFESVNEFRGALDNQQRTLIPRSEVDVLIRGLEAKISDVVKQQDAQIAERLGVRGGWGYAVGVVGFVIAILTISSLVFRAAPQNIVVPSATVAPTSLIR